MRIWLRLFLRSYSERSRHTLFYMMFFLNCIVLSLHQQLVHSLGSDQDSISLFPLQHHLNSLKTLDCLFLQIYTQHIHSLTMSSLLNCLEVHILLYMLRWFLLALLIRRTWRSYRCLSEEIHSLICSLNRMLILQQTKAHFSILGLSLTTLSSSIYFFCSSVTFNGFITWSMLILNIQLWWTIRLLSLLSPCTVQLD